MSHFAILRRRVVLLAAWLLPMGACNAQAATGGAAGPTHQDKLAAEVYSAPALFNRANAYARQGRVGQAILNYERALLLAPADADVAANLHFVRARAGLPNIPQSELVRRLTSVRPNALACLGCLGLVLAGLSLVLGHYFPVRRLIFRLVTLTGALLVATAVASAILTWPRVHDAVVLASEAPARISPAAFAEQAFTLKEGETVTVRSEHDGFLLVQTRVGRTGWVANADVARIVPSIHLG